MRHEISTTIDIEASPQAVWNLLVDLPGYAAWNPFITSAAGQVKVGGRLDLRLNPPGGKGMRFLPTVTQVDEGHVLEWLGSLGLRGLFDGRHRFELEPTTTGTQLLHREQFSGLLVRAARRSLDGPTSEGFEQMNAALRAQAEARRSGAV